MSGELLELEPAANIGVYGDDQLIRDEIMSKAHRPRAAMGGRLPATVRARH